MSELAHRVDSEVKKFLNSDRGDISREISRKATINGAIINQSKYVSPEEIKIVREKGAQALASTEWFNDVTWRQAPDSQERSYNDLHLDALHPLDNFTEKPTTGTFSGDNFLDQYGSVSGIGDGNVVKAWFLDFVAPDGKDIQTLSYPQNPDAMAIYNARYQQYLDDLNQADPKVSYHRGWDVPFSSLPDDHELLVTDNLMIGGFGTGEVLSRGSSSETNIADYTRILLHFAEPTTKDVGIELFIKGDDATAESYFHSKKKQKKASKKLLSATLELIEDLNTSQGIE